MPRPRTETPALVERENGVWYVQWHDADRKRLVRESLHTRDHLTAVRLYAEFLLGGEARRARRDDGLTVGQALEDYWSQHVTAEDEKGRTHVVDTKRVRYAIDYLKGYMGDRFLKDIGPAECRGYVTERRKTMAIRRGTPVRDATIRKELAFLTAAANHAVRWKALARTDLPVVEMPRVERSGGPKWFTKAQVQSLIAGTSGDLQHFIRISYYTAARRRSIERLVKFQVKFDEGVIYLQPPDGRMTKKRRPAVPIFPEIRAAVQDLYDRAGENSYLFGHHGKSFYKGFVEACRAIGVPHGHPHMLRHSRASHMLQDGEDIWRVARLLGDTVATVETVYAHCLPHHLLTESNVEAPRTLADMIS